MKQSMSAHPIKKTCSRDFFQTPALSKRRTRYATTLSDHVAIASRPGRDYRLQRFRRIVAVLNTPKSRARPRLPVIEARGAIEVRRWRRIGLAQFSFLRNPVPLKARGQHHFSPILRFPLTLTQRFASPPFYACVILYGVFHWLFEHCDMIPNM